MPATAIYCAIASILFHVETTRVALRDKPQHGSWNRATGVSDWGQRSGLDESGARTKADAERPKSSVSERAKRVSFDDFSGAGAGVSPSHRSRDLFGSFLDRAKNERRRAGTSIDIQDESPCHEETAPRASCG
jgi:hypothetical protein